MSDQGARVDIADLVAQHHLLIYRYAFRLTGRAADAEDLTQQTFLLAQRHLHQLRDAERAKSWLCTILRNCYQLQLRKERRTPGELVEFDLALLPEEALADEIDREELQAAIDELPCEFKTVLLLFYFEDCSYREIAARLDVPVGTVMSRLSRAKGHLRGRLFPAIDPPPENGVEAGVRGERERD